jgi:HAE1 family hydrophobic/amphiphilic exporter-1
MVSFNLAPGVSVGDAVIAVQAVADEVTAPGTSTSFTGSAKAFQEAFRTLPMLMLVTIILIYMILAILYEHYGHPFTILTALPFAGFGAEAIVEACLVRFRPIMMTTGAAIFATLPIALGFGAGAETRRPLGIAVVGGLVFSQLLTLYVTPVFYVTLERMVGYFRRYRAAEVTSR